MIRSLGHFFGNLSPGAGVGSATLNSLYVI